MVEIDMAFSNYREISRSPSATMRRLWSSSSLNKSISRYFPLSIAPGKQQDGGYPVDLLK